MMKLLDGRPEYLEYDLERYPFRQLIEAHLGMSALEEIPSDSPLVTRETDQSSPLLKRLYRIGSVFFGLYEEFLLEIVRPLFEEAVLYQKIPNFRIAFPENMAVGEFHRDRDYGHSPKEMNFILPFTKAAGTSATWIESEDGKGDYRPYDLEEGRILVFAGANLRHGNVPNKTGKNRLSMDFRVLRISDYTPSDRKTVNSGLAFKIGGYWKGPLS
jgi:hypothetical protein